MTPILLYSHVNEPLTQILLSPCFDQKHGLIKLSLEDLLNDVRIFDELNDDEAKINWTLSSGLEIVNSDDVYLINRVISVPENIFFDFSEEDKIYSISEFRAYLAFAIESFPNSFSKPGAFGLSGNRASLPRQWDTIKRSEVKCRIPHHYLGNMEFCPFKGDIVYTHPFDFYYWKANRDCVDFEKTSFAFLMPVGTPVVACIIGEDVEIFCCNLQDEVSIKMTVLLKENALLISRLFNYFIAEILFFVEKDHLVFGMISSIPYASSKKNWFSPNICDYFQGKLMEGNGEN